MFSYSKSSDDKKKYNTSMDDRMYKYIDSSKHKSDVKPYESYIVTLKGAKFYKVTNKMRKLYDKRYLIAMMNTMDDIVRKFNANTGHVSDDIITIVFSSVLNKEQYDKTDNNTINHIENGDISKIVSILTSYASVRFYHNMINKLSRDDDPSSLEIMDILKSYDFYFEGSYIIFDSSNDYDIVNYLLWRSTRMTYLKCADRYLQHYFSKSELNHKAFDEKIQMMRKSTGFNFHKDVPDYVKYGIYAKAVLLKNIDSGKIRTDIINRAFRIKCDEATVSEIKSKYWTRNNGLICETESMEKIIESHPTIIHDLTDYEYQSNAYIHIAKDDILQYVTLFVSFMVTYFIFSHQ